MQRCALKTGDMVAVAPSSGPPLLRAIVFLPAAIALLAAAWFAAADVRAFLASSEIAPGVVTRLLAGPSHPEIAFTPRGGPAVDFPQGGWVGGYKPGQSVTVRYDQSRPRATAQVDTWGALWGVTSLLTILGLAALGAGLASLVEVLRR